MRRKKTDHLAKPRAAATNRKEAVRNHAATGSPAIREMPPEGSARSAARSHLERANAVLFSSIEKFAIGQSPEAFIDAIMHTIAAALDADSVIMTRWQEDGYAHVYRLLENGVVQSGEDSDHPNARCPTLIADHPWTKKAIAGGKEGIEYLPLDKLTDLTPAQLEHLRAKGTGALVTSIIRSGRKIIGSFSARLGKDRPEPEPEQLSLMRSLAAHGALALEMGRLTEAARDGAIREERIRLAHEGEQAARKRAAQLERANAVLSSSIENFAVEQGPDAFLDAIMHTIASALGVHSVTVWRWTDDDHAHLHRILEQGVVLAGERSDHPHAQRPVFLPDYPWVTAMLAEGRHITEVMPLSREMGLTAELLAYLRARKVRAVITAAIRSGNKVIGSFTARLQEGHPDPGPEQIALMRSLAAHGALALEMGRLTEAARDGAIREERIRLAHEREQAARERAAELEHVNAVLSNAVENFAIEQGPDAFLDAIMHTIVSALNVDSVDMWRWQDNGLAYLHRLLENSVVLPGEQADGHPNAHEPAILANFPWTREVTAGGKQITEIIPLHKREGFDAAQLAYLRARQVRALMVSTIRSGNKVIGSFTAWLPKGSPDPGPDRRALMRSLAAHGALALEMGRLTEAARVGAIREERTRMARDLHDSLAQGFTGIVVQLEAVHSALASKDLVKARARAAAAGELARDSLQQARRAVHALRPSILEDRNLVAALRSLTESTFTGSPVEVETRFHGIARPLSPEAEENLLRIAQEALTNVLKHGRAQRVRLSLNYRRTLVILRVDDDGCGFKPVDRRRRAQGGLGLIGIRERADRLGATLAIENRRDGGASIIVKLPTKRDSTDQA